MEGFKTKVCKCILVQGTSAALPFPFPAAGGIWVRFKAAPVGPSGFTPVAISANSGAVPWCCVYLPHQYVSISSPCSASWASFPPMGTGLTSPGCWGHGGEQRKIFQNGSNSQEYLERPRSSWYVESNCQKHVLAHSPVFTPRGTWAVWQPRGLGIQQAWGSRLVCYLRGRFPRASHWHSYRGDHSLG